MKKLMTFMLSLVLCATAFAGQLKPRHTGNWWKQKSPTFREAYVSGYKSGKHDGMGKDTNLTPLGERELVDGLDKFYSDFRNRNILFADAIAYVADQLRGVPDDKLAAEILRLRAASASAGAED